MTENKIRAKTHWKKIAREKGKNKSPKIEAQPLTVGIKRVGKLIFEEGEETLQKRRLTISNTSQTEFEEGSMVVARQHRREP